MQLKKYQDVIKNIDWDLLQHQKGTLEKLLTNIPFHPPVLNNDINNLWGLIELIENFQDVHKSETNIMHFERLRN